MAAITAAHAEGVKYVAVVETELDATSGASGSISSAEVRQITAELRREAVKNLPPAKYNIMTSETVQAQGGAVLEECAEENCVITLGSKIGADYIVRGIISKFSTMLTLSVEVYETEDGTLVASSEPVRSESIVELLEKTAPACANMYKAFTESRSSAQKAPATAATYALNAAANPPYGGAVSRSPNRQAYAPGTNVSLIASPANGYRFIGWSGDAADTAALIAVTVEDDMTLTANFQQEFAPPPQVVVQMPPPIGMIQEPPVRKRYTLAAVSLDIIGAGLLAYGIYQDNNIKTYEKDGYENRAAYDDAKVSEVMRNIGYALGGALLLSGISVHIFF